MSKKMFIKDFKDHIGEEIKQPFLLKAVFYNNNRFNNQWQDLLIVDRTGSSLIKAWSENMNNGYDKYIDNVVWITGVIDLYKSKPGITVSNIEPCEQYDLSDYIQMLSKDCIDGLREKLNNYIGLMSDGPYKNVVQNAFNNTIVQAMTQLPAGTSSHNYCGALLIHTLEVVETALACIKTFEDLSLGKPYVFTVDKDLVIAGALLHDIGKFRSFQNFPDMKKTIRGYKVPSHIESISIIDAYNSKLNKSKQIKDLSDLRHIIAAAGNEVDPMTLEAIIVANANRISKEVDDYFATFIKYDSEHPGNESMSAYSSGLGRRVVRKRKEV